MRRGWVAAVAGFAALMLPAPALAAGRSDALCRPWKIVSSPPISGNALFYSTSGTSTSDVWAVGNDGFNPVIEHFDGTAWTLSPNQQVSGGLQGVTVISSTDAWAAGGQGFGTLAEHWDGSTWTIVPTPHPGTESVFYGASASSSNDVWAAGDWVDSQGRIHGLAEHWDGTSWSVTAVPDASAYANVFYGVAAVGLDDAWAIGYQETNPQTLAIQPLIEHWDGTAWTVVAPAPPPLGNNNALRAVSGVSSTDVWAVGAYGSTSKGQPLFEHWDGTIWSVVPGPPISDLGSLRGVVAISTTDVWAVGYSISSEVRTLTEHWDGTAWTVEGSPSPNGNAVLWAAEASGPHDVWAVGDYGGSSVIPLAMHSKGPCP